MKLSLKAEKNPKPKLVKSDIKKLPKRCTEPECDNVCDSFASKTMCPAHHQEAFAW